MFKDKPKSSCVAILGSLELFTSLPDGDGGDFDPPAVAAFEAPGRGSGDRSRSDSGEEAYERREFIGKRKSSERYSSS